MTNEKETNHAFARSRSNAGLGLIARIEAHIRQLSPHMMQRDGVTLLREALGAMKQTCAHEFSLTDLRLTGIPELEKPTTNGYAEWEKYFREIYTHESVTKRVAWPCCKCGEVFYAHCGLDVYKHGTAQQRVPNVELTSRPAVGRSG